MKSSPLSNRHTSNPSEASKRPVDLSTVESSSTKQTISDEGFSAGMMGICATGFSSMWDMGEFSCIFLLYNRFDVCRSYQEFVAGYYTHFADLCVEHHLLRRSNRLVRCQLPVG